MSYLVLARKYRPQTFEDVVKQEHVTQTLTNAINTGRVAHAILFSGPRGTGKTTIARILAKSMNCQKGPTPTPCNVCQSCLEITRSNAADVFEIDGASNNSVDQIRELRDNIKYMPSHSPYKIYIIDEVHMLSIAAFNALLKTLEEPPEHVMFLFATTEPHKIPVTILSRCQQHDLRRIDAESIAGHLSSLCQRESIDIAMDSLRLIAREADGCMRDALSLLDQTISFTTGAISHEQIISIIGAIDRKILFDSSRAIINNDIGHILEILDEAYYRGVDLKKFFGELIEHFRNLTIVKMGKNINRLIDLPKHEIEQMQDLVANVPQHFLIQLLELLFRQETSLRMANDPKLVLEMTFIKAFQTKPALPIDELIQKLDNLRQGIVPEEAPQPLSPPQIQHPQPNGEDIAPAKPEVQPENQTGRTDSQAQPAPPAYPDRERYSGQESPEKIWTKITRTFNERYPSLAACLEESRIASIAGNEVTIEITGTSFNIGIVKRDKNQAILKQALENYFGAPKMLKLIENVKSSHLGHRNKDEHQKLKQEAMNHPLVAETIEVFNGRVVDVKILQEE